LNVIATRHIKYENDVRQELMQERARSANLTLELSKAQAMVRLVELGYCGKTTLLNPG